MRDLIKKINETLSVINKIVEKSNLDEFQKNALIFLANRLAEISDECQTGNIQKHEERKGEISRIVVETDPCILSPDIGGQLIEIEKAYYK